MLPDGRVQCVPQNGEKVDPLFELFVPPRLSARGQ